jgi:hypothetical protein
MSGVVLKHDMNIKPPGTPSIFSKAVRWKNHGGHDTISLYSIAAVANLIHLEGQI